MASEILVNLTKQSEIKMFQQTSVKISQTKGILTMIIIINILTFIYEALNHIQGPEVEIIICWEYRDFSNIFHMLLSSILCCYSWNCKKKKP